MCRQRRQAADADADVDAAAKAAAAAGGGRAAGRRTTRGQKDTSAEAVAVKVEKGSEAAEAGAKRAATRKRRNA